MGVLQKLPVDFGEEQAQEQMQEQTQEQAVELPDLDKHGENHAIQRPESCKGRTWTVVSSLDQWGITVHKTKSLQSRQFVDRLATGAKVEELEKVGNRFHYKKIEGD